MRSFGLIEKHEYEQHWVLASEKPYESVYKFYPLARSCTQAVFHARENGGNTQSLHRMTQGGAPLFLKGLHHAPGRGNEVCLGGGNHRFYLLDFAFRRCHKLRAFGPDSLVVELANLQTDLSKWVATSTWYFSPHNAFASFSPISWAISGVASPGAKLW